MISESGWKDKNRKGKPEWIDYWNDYQNETGLTQLQSLGVQILTVHKLFGNI